MIYRIDFTGYYLVEADSPGEALDKANDEDYKVLHHDLDYPREEPDADLEP